MNERLDPEEVREITGRIFGGAREIIDKYEGFIELFAGDGVLVLFGAPVIHEDDPIRAIRAAREIHELVDKLSPNYEPRIGRPLAMHSGINTGMAVAADVDTEKGTHGVTGDVINTAARLSGLAGPGEIFAGPETALRASSHFVFQRLEDKTVKGKAKPVEVHQVIAPVASAGAEARRARFRAQLTGRAPELARLRAAVTQAQGSQGGIVEIRGDTGVGKTRLAEEVYASLEPQAVQWLEGRAYAFSQNIPYALFIDLFSRLWNINDGDPADRVRAKIEAGTRDILGQATGAAPILGRLFALTYPETEVMGPEFWRVRVSECIRDLMAALTQRGPLVICLDNLQWADGPTLELLRSVACGLVNRALFLLLYRPPFSLFAANCPEDFQPRRQVIDVTELSIEDTDRMSESLLGGDRLPAELRAFVAERSSGNPFYIEAIIESLADQGTITSTADGWRLAGELDARVIPPTIRGVIAARIDRLNRNQKRALQEAAVIGREFSVRVLQRISEIGEPVPAVLDELVQLGFLRRTATSHDTLYAFTHAIAQDVAYDGLLKKARGDLHEQIGLVIENLYRDRLPEFTETLAHHFQRGHSKPKAIQYLMAAGQKSLDRFSVEDAFNYCVQAHELLTSEPLAETTRTILLLDLLLQWGLVVYYRGGFDKFGELMASYEPIVAGLDDPSRLGMFYAWLGWCQFWRGRVVESRALLEKAFAIGQQAQDNRVMAYAACWQGFVLTELGAFSNAVHTADLALQLGLSVPGDAYLHSKPITARGQSLYFMGEARQAQQAATELMARGQADSNIRGIVMGHVIDAFAQLGQGNFAAAVAAGQTAVNITRDPLYRRYAEISLCLAYGISGQFAEALAIARETNAFCYSAGLEVLGAYSTMISAASLIGSGEMSTGFRQLRALARELEQAGRMTCYSITLQLIANVCGQLALRDSKLPPRLIARNIPFLLRYVPFASRRAIRRYQTALRAAEQIGAKGIIAQCLLELGRLHRANRRADLAKQCFARAAALFEETGADVYLARVRAFMISSKDDPDGV